MPNEVSGLSDVLTLSYGADHGCAVRNGGEMYCWGRNQHGRLGDGTEVDRSTAVRIFE